jgi:adenylate cyclase
VHKDVLKELVASGGVMLGGEKRDITVLFSDLRGFTTFSEHMTPEALTSLLNEYLTAMSPVILEKKGTIDKFIGDAIMAFWNAPLKVAHHEEAAVLAALHMQKALKQFNQVHNATLAMGIGVHTGNAVVGNVGSLDRVNYTALGDTVNIGSRVESLTKKYGVEVMATGEVRDKVAHSDIAFRKLEVVMVKGKSTPTTLYEAVFKEEKRDDLWNLYEEALTFYEKGELDAAKALFEQGKNKGDISAAKILERIDAIDRSTWDGVYRWDEK